MRKQAELFKTALGNTTFLSNVTSSVKNQLQFHQTLKEGEYSPEEVIEFIHSVENNKIRSLLITYLLSQQEYLLNLKGESILDRLAHDDNSPLPSRLNAWVHQLDLTVLSPEMINKLTPEAAVSLLCSIPHFHQLSKEQIVALLNRHLEHHFIVYWIRNFSSMPNACNVLVHLIQTIHATVFEALNEIERTQKETILVIIIKHLDLFVPLPKNILSLLDQEIHLVLAMKLYLNCHYHRAYTDFIEQLTQYLLNSKHVFSDATLELLLSLNQVSELQNTIKSMSEHTNRYLRTKALSGIVTPLYQDGLINIARMTQDILITNAPADQTELQAVGPEECKLAAQIAREGKSLNVMEYFLIHYHGDAKPIHNMLNDYLQHYAYQEKSTSRDRALNHLAVLLLNKHPTPEVKEGIFTALLHYPDLCDDFISQKLFLYDTHRTINYFGLKGGAKNYRTLSNISQLALKKLDPQKNQDLFKVLQQVQKEAEIELQLCNIQGWFSNVIKYIKRCFIYGWSGFFSPIPPVYVTPESASRIRTLIEPDAELRRPLDTVEKDLSALLVDADSKPLTQELFEHFVEALGHYSFKDMINNEYDTRLKLNNLYYKVLANKEQHLGLYIWLMENQSSFLTNQYCLVELALKEKSPAEINNLLMQIHERTTGKLKRVCQELKCSLPEQREKSRPPVIEQRIIPPAIIEKATETVSSYTTEAGQYVKGFWQAAGSFFTTPLCSAKGTKAIRHDPAPSI